MERPCGKAPVGLLFLYRLFLRRFLPPTACEREDTAGHNFLGPALAIDLLRKASCDQEKIMFTGGNEGGRISFLTLGCTNGWLFFS
jgi:hypothetical protein